MNNSNENNLIFNSIDNLYSDDDKYYLADDSHSHSHSHSVMSLYSNNNNNITTTLTTNESKILSPRNNTTNTTNYNFNLNLSSLQSIGSVNNNDMNINNMSPRRDENYYKDTLPRESPRRRENENFSIGDPLSRVRGDVDSFFAPRDPQMPRRESEGYYSPRELTPRELTPRGSSSNNNNNNLNGNGNGSNNNNNNTGIVVPGLAIGAGIGGADSFFLSNDQNQRDSLSRTRENEPYYSPRDLLRHSTENYPLPAPRRENESYYPGKDLTREHLVRGREDGYYSPREQSHSVLPPKPSPRDNYYSQPERTISHDSEQAYFGSREATPRDPVYRRDSSESSFYHSPRDPIPSPRGGGGQNDNYYSSSREPTPRDHIQRPSGLQTHGDKSVPNPYAAPFVPQRSLSNPNYTVPPLQIPSTQYNNNNINKDRKSVV